MNAQILQFSGQSKKNKNKKEILQLLNYYFIKYGEKSALNTALEFKNGICYYEELIRNIPYDENNLGRRIGNTTVKDYARFIENSFMANTSTLQDYAVIKGYAAMSGNARMKDYAIAEDYARIMNRSEVNKYGHILDNAVISLGVLVTDNSTVGGMTQLCGNIRVSGKTVLDTNTRTSVNGPYLLDIHNDEYHYDGRIYNNINKLEILYPFNIKVRKLAKTKRNKNIA